MDISDNALLVFALSTVVLGMLILIRCGDWIVDGAVFIARKAGISMLLVGFTIVAFGTSLPELIVSVNASLKGSPGIAVGNVIGSNIANILLVIGAGAVCRTLVANRKKLALDMGKMMLASTLCVCLLLYGVIGAMTGVLMILTLIGYVFLQYQRSKTAPQDTVIATVVQEEGSLAPVMHPHHAQTDENDMPVFKSVWIAALFVVCGIIGLAFGADLMVRGAITSAAILNVPDAIVGLTVIAVGTSLPELSTSIIAALKKQGDIVLGNVIGSNVFNIMMILGATAIINPISAKELPPQMIHFDMWVMLGVAALFCVLVIRPGQFSRVTGGIFLAGYAAYIGAMALMNT